MIRSWMRPAETLFKEPFGGTCAWLITSQRSVLVCMSCPLRGSRRRTFTSTRPPVGFRPFITWKEGRARRLIAVTHSGDSAPRPSCPPLTSMISLISLCVSSLSSFTAAVPMGLSLRRKPLGGPGGDNPTTVSGNLYGIPLAGIPNASATHPLCSSSSLRPRDDTTLLNPRWLRLIDSVKLWLYSREKEAGRINDNLLLAVIKQRRPDPVLEGRGPPGISFPWLTRFLPGGKENPAGGAALKERICYENFHSDRAC